MTLRGGDRPLWTPSPERAAASGLGRFMAATGHGDYPSLHRWSLQDPAGFWTAAWDELGVIGDRGDRAFVDADELRDARFFPDAALNVAENLLRRRGDGAAIVYRDEDPDRARTVTHEELWATVGRLQAALADLGVGPGHRVAAWMPNTPETIAVMLATAALGATFSSTSPDFGADGVIDRFGQIEPTVLFAADRYRYGGRIHDRTAVLDEVTAALGSLRRRVVVPYDDPASFGGFLDGIEPRDPEFTALPFDHPWYVLYSSGTTGTPKCIEHRAGGVLLKHLVEHRLHCDVRRDDRVFYFTTAGWMMWNWLASALASEATVVCYDGSPFHPDGDAMFDLIDDVGVHLFGTSAKFIEAVGKEGLRPAATHDLSSLRTVCSTGSPLVPEGFRTVYDAIAPDVHLASISGGTDLCGCLVAGDPTSSVWAGEIQRPGLGMAIDVLDPDGRPLEPRQQGELVCRRPFPSMPRGFVGDADGDRYRRAYFDRFDGLWHQGDFAEWTDHGGIVIHGRSDATLNPGGVRIGTAEIYRQVDKVPEVAESIVIGQPWADDTRVVLFVVLRGGATLDEELRDRIRSTVRAGATPRHVPAVIAEVPEIPRTRSGKITELAVRATVQGETVANTEALANPDALAHFADHPALRS